MIRLKGNHSLELSYSQGYYHLALSHEGAVANYIGRLDEIQEVASVEGFILDVWDFLEVYAPLLFGSPRAGLAEYTALLHPELGVYCIARGIAPNASDLFENLDQLKLVTEEVLTGVALLFPDLKDWQVGEWAVTRGIGVA